MTYGKKVMTIGGVRVTDARSKDGACTGCVFRRDIHRCIEASKRTDVFHKKCGHRNAIYIPAPDDLKEEA